jgi:hypothetical protein
MRPDRHEGTSVMCTVACVGAQSGPKSTPTTPFRAGSDGWVARTGLLPGELCPCSAAKNSRATSVRRRARSADGTGQSPGSPTVARGDPPGYFQPEWAHVVVEDFERGTEPGHVLIVAFGEAYRSQLLHLSPCASTPIAECRSAVAADSVEPGNRRRPTVADVRRGSPVRR